MVTQNLIGHNLTHMPRQNLILPGFGREFRPRSFIFRAPISHFRAPGPGPRAPGPGPRGHWPPLAPIFGAQGGPGPQIWGPGAPNLGPNLFIWAPWGPRAPLGPKFGPLGPRGPWAPLGPYGSPIGPCGSPIGPSWVLRVLFHLLGLVVGCADVQPGRALRSASA